MVQKSTALILATLVFTVVTMATPLPKGGSKSRSGLSKSSSKSSSKKTSMGTSKGLSQGFRKQGIKTAKKMGGMTLNAGLSATRNAQTANTQSNQQEVEGRDLEDIYTRGYLEENDGIYGRDLDELEDLD